MYKNKKIILTICARGGSKGLPGKNIKGLLGKPLIAYTIEQAKSLSWVDKIVVSTEDQKIKETAERWGIPVPFLRPKKLAGDKISKTLVMINALDAAEKYWQEKYDIIVDLDPTSPLRSIRDINLSRKIFFQEQETTAVVTAYESNKNPYFNMLEENGVGYVHLSKKPKSPITGRQAAPKVYSMNASIYILRVKNLREEKTVLTKRTRLYVMPFERSIDIDNQLDFDFVEFLMTKGIKK